MYIPSIVRRHSLPVLFLLLIGTASNGQDDYPEISMDPYPGMSCSTAEGACAKYFPGSTVTGACKGADCFPDNPNKATYKGLAKRVTVLGEVGEYSNRWLVSFSKKATITSSVCGLSGTKGAPNRVSPSQPLEVTVPTWDVDPSPTGENWRTICRFIIETDQYIYDEHFASDEPRCLGWVECRLPNPDKAKDNAQERE